MNVMRRKHPADQLEGGKKKKNYNSTTTKEYTKRRINFFFFFFNLIIGVAINRHLRTNRFRIWTRLRHQRIEIGPVIVIGWNLPRGTCRVILTDRYSDDRRWSSLQWETKFGAYHLNLGLTSLVLTILLTLNLLNMYIFRLLSVV